MEAQFAHGIEEVRRNPASGPGTSSVESSLWSGGSGVSWGAIFAGAAASAALSLLLLMLGVGLGLSSVSPWAGDGVSATTFTVSTVVWLTFTQLAASGMGGYLAGRLRTRWSGIHTDEVYFRDTAHGFLAWAVASLATAALLGSAVGGIVSGGVKAGASVAGGAASAVATAGASAAGAAGSTAASQGGGSSSMGGSTNYFVDSLFRKGADAPATQGSSGDSASSSASSTAEVGRIFVNGLAAGDLPKEDATYVGQVVAQRTGLSQQDAEKRVTDTFAKAQAKIKETQEKAKEAADQARKASAYGTLWLFVSMLFGAFVASLMATYGGRRRDTSVVNR